MPRRSALRLLRMKLRLPALAASLILCALALPVLAQLKLPSQAPGTLTSPSQPLPATAPSDGADVEQKVKNGQTAAAAWLLLLDTGNYGRAWDESSTVFRSTVPLGQWMDGIPALRRPFGGFKERQPAGAEYKTTLQGRPNGEYVTASFTSDFAERQGVVEIVTTVREPDGRWRVTGYSTR